MPKWKQDEAVWRQDEAVIPEGATPSAGKPSLTSIMGGFLGDVGQQAGQAAQQLGQVIGSPEVARPVAETIGGSVGGLLGSPLGPLGTATGVGLGAAAGHQLESLYRRTLGDEPRGAGQVALESGIAGAVEPALGAAGELAGAGLRYGAGKLTRGMLGGGTPEAAEKLGAYTRSGVTPTMGGTGGAIPQQTQETLLRMPGGAGVVREAAEKTNREMVETLGKITEKGVDLPSTPYLAGERAKKGMNVTKRAFGIKSEKLFRELRDVVPPDSKVEISNFVDAVQNPAKEFVGTPYEEFGKEVSASPIFERWKNVLEKGATKDEQGNIIAYEPMTWDQIKKIRTELGSMLKKPMLSPDTKRSQIEQLYGALSADMRDAALREGGEEGLKRFETANNFYSQSINTIRETVDKKLQMDSARLFESIERGSVDDINKIKGFVPNKHWKDVRAEVARKLGLVGRRVDVEEGEGFNPVTFLRRWHELSPEKKKAIFGPRGRMEGIVEDLNEISKVSKSIEQMKNFANPSGTTGSAWTTYLIGGVVGGTGGAAATGTPEGGIAGMVAGGSLMAKASFGSWVIANALTEPKFAKWLAQANRFKTKTLGFANHVGRLSKMEFEPEIAQLRDTIVETYDQLSDNWGELRTFEPKE